VSVQDILNAHIKRSAEIQDAAAAHIKRVCEAHVEVVERKLRNDLHVAHKTFDLDEELKDDKPPESVS
jgi:hypothetical protein